MQAAALTAAAWLYTPAVAVVAGCAAGCAAGRAAAAPGWFVQVPCKVVSLAAQRSPVAVLGR